MTFLGFVIALSDLPCFLEGSFGRAWVHPWGGGCQDTAFCIWCLKQRGNAGHFFVRFFLETPFAFSEVLSFFFCEGVLGANFGMSIEYREFGWGVCC